MRKLGQELVSVRRRNWNNTCQSHGIRTLDRQNPASVYSLFPPWWIRDTIPFRKTPSGVFALTHLASRSSPVGMASLACGMRGLISIGLLYSGKAGPSLVLHATRSRARSVLGRPGIWEYTDGWTRVIRTKSKKIKAEKILVSIFPILTVSNC